MSYRLFREYSEILESGSLLPLFYFPHSELFVGPAMGKDNF
jgi:hypothetical protein